MLEYFGKHSFLLVDWSILPYRFSRICKEYLFLDLNDMNNFLDLNDMNNGLYKEALKQLLRDYAKRKAANIGQVGNSDHYYVFFIGDSEVRVQFRFSADRDTFMGSYGKKAHKENSQNTNTDILDVDEKNMLRQMLHTASFTKYNVFVSVGIKAGINGLQVEQNTNATMGDPLQVQTVILFPGRLIIAMVMCFWSG